MLPLTLFHVVTYTFFRLIALLLKASQGSSLDLTPDSKKHYISIQVRDMSKT